MVSSKVLVIGQGYVGLPVAVRAVQVGHDVVGLDNDEQRVARLAAGDSFVEDVRSDELGQALASGRFAITTEQGAAEGFDVAVITVPTPLRDGLPDLTYIEIAARNLGPYVRPGALVVLESTTYPGTTEELMVPILEAGSGLKAGPDFHVAYSPERIDPGNQTWRFHNTPKVVGGIDADSLAIATAFYGSLVETVVPVQGCKEAELTKLLENTFRHVNVALVNELAAFANDLGIDVWASIDAASTKPFGYMRFTPGPGVGGHCLPIDPSYLSWRVKQSLGRTFRFVELANDVNEHMPDYVVSRLMLGLNRRRRALNGATLLLLGLSYKRNAGDARESPAIRVAELLIELGADVHGVDPHVPDWNGPLTGISRAELTAETLRSADAVVVLTDHDAFDYDLVAAEAPYVLDTRNRVARRDTVEIL